MTTDNFGALLPSQGELGQADLESHVEAFLDSGQTFLAQDLARQGLDRLPKSDRLRVALALALARTSAIDDARKALDPLLARFQLRDSEINRAWTAFAGVVAAMPRAAVADEKPSAAVADELVALATALDDLRGRATLNEVVAPETLAALAEVYGLAWRHDRDQESLLLARDLYREAFKAGRDPRHGVSAAGLAALLGDKREARSLAKRALSALGEEPDDVEDGFHFFATQGLANLLLGDAKEADFAFRGAAFVAGGPSELALPYIRQIRLWESEGAIEASSAADALEPPNVIVFTGHAIDHPNSGETRFPPELEDALRHEIKAKLDELNVQIGYCSAACGADLLFIEAMMERDAKVNVILPCGVDDYVAASVAYAGSRWEKRFRNALRLADTVSFATTEPYLGHDSVYRFGNQMLHGMAILRAQFLETAPHLLAVWDMKEGSLPGGAADFIDQWGDISRLRIIDLDDLLTTAQEDGSISKTPSRAPEAPAIAVVEPEREIRAMLFADIVGFSKLSDANLPDYMKFLDRLSKHLRKTDQETAAINTWGDAFFVVMDRADDLLRYAFALKQGVTTLSRGKKNGDLNLNVRISLHAGPVYGGKDPFRKQFNFYGAHINRAARLEPVTVPGQIYATQQFVSLLTINATEQANEAEMDGEAAAPGYVSEYVGTLSLAKNFGTQPVYHLREAETA